MSAFLDFVGVFVSAAWQRRFFRRQARRSRRPWRARARTEAEVVVSLDLDAARAICTRVLAAVAERHRPQEPDGDVEAVSPASWRSSGTMIRIHVEPAGDRTRIVVATWPGAQLFDWGESRRVAEDVVARLRASVPATED